MTALADRPTKRLTQDPTPDSHDFPTRPYDLVKEFVIALTAIIVVTVLLAAIFSSPDDKAISLRQWAKIAPNDVIATATAELAGTSTSAGYGGPYNTASDGPKLGPLTLQKWAGVRIPVDSAKDLVLDPVRTLTTDTAVVQALQAWDSATPDQQASWSSAYADALAAAPDGDAATVAAGDYGPVPALAKGELTLAASGSLEGLLTSGSTFYTSDSTKPLLLLADGAYLEDQARAQHLGGDQWGMMNDVGNYPGQPWLWLYTFWYQVKPFSTSDNADIQVFALMMLLSAGFIAIPWIPGIRSIPQKAGVYKLIWRRR